MEYGAHAQISISARNLWFDTVFQGKIWLLTDSEMVWLREISAWTAKDDRYIGNWTLLRMTKVLCFLMLIKRNSVVTAL